MKSYLLSIASLGFSHGFTIHTPLSHRVQHQQVGIKMTPYPSKDNFALEHSRTGVRNNLQASLNFPRRKAALNGVAFPPSAAVCSRTEKPPFYKNLGQFTKQKLIPLMLMMAVVAAASHTAFFHSIPSKVASLFWAYEHSCVTNPVITKACTSGVAYTLGDFLAQTFNKNKTSRNWARTVRSGAAGFIGHGTLVHFWLQFMENNLSFGGAWWAIPIKVFADQTFFTLILNSVFCTLSGILAFKPLKTIWKDLKRSTWPAMRSSWRLWPFVHCISFSPLIPYHFKLIFIDAVEVVWVIILSRIANNDAEANSSEQKPAAAGSVAADKTAADKAAADTAERVAKVKQPKTITILEGSLSGDQTQNPQQDGSEQEHTEAHPVVVEMRSVEGDLVQLNFDMNMTIVGNEPVVNVTSFLVNLNEAGVDTQNVEPEQDVMLKLNDDATKGSLIY